MKEANPFIGEYIDFLSGFLHTDAKTLDIVFDCSSGSTGPIIEALMRHVTCDMQQGRWVILNGRPDGNFSKHAPDPLHAGSLGALQKSVVVNGADVGIIFDADGDRVFFIDNLGRFIDQDVVAYLLLWSLRPKRFVTDAKDGWLVREAPFGVRRITSKTGHYHIKQTMRVKNVELGCERSGHYYFKNFFFCDSGIMAAIEVLNAIAQLPYRLSDLVDLLPETYRMQEINVPILSFDSDALFARIERVYKKEAAHVSKIDGIAMEFSDPDWWFNVRASNTEPLVRLNMEARDKRVYEAQLKKLTELLKKGSK